MLLSVRSVLLKAMLFPSNQPYFNPASENNANQKVRNKQPLRFFSVGSSYPSQRSHAVTFVVLVHAGGRAVLKYWEVQITMFQLFKMKDVIQNSNVPTFWNEYLHQETYMYLIEEKIKVPLRTLHMQVFWGYNPAKICNAYSCFMEYPVIVEVGSFIGGCFQHLRWTTNSSPGSTLEMEPYKVREKQGTLPGEQLIQL